MEAQDQGNGNRKASNIVHDAARNRREDRWALLWDVLVFQIKLGLDALRDLVLSPLSFGALLLGALAGGNNPYRYFEGLLRFGRQTERIINLFGTARVPYDPYEGTSDKMAVDKLFANVEELLRRNVDGSQKASAARAKVDTTIDELEARLEKLRAKARQRFANPPGSPPREARGATPQPEKQSEEQPDKGTP